MYYLMRRIKTHNIIISIFSLMLITSSFGIMTIHFAYGQTNQGQVNIDIDAILAAIIWPVFAGIVLILVVAHRQRLGPFIKELRISKVSVGPLSVDLAEIRASKPNLEVNTGEGSFDLRRESIKPLGSDTKKTLLKQIRQGSPTDFTIFDLGDGTSWLSSRVFLFTIVLQKLYALKSIIFTCTIDGITDRFVGITEPEQLHYALAKKYPWLESAYAEVYINNWPKGEEAWGHLFSSLDSAKTTDIVTDFLRKIQVDRNGFDNLSPHDKSEYTSLRENWEHAERMTKVRVEEILGQALDKCISESDLQTRSKEDQIRLILSFNGSYIAVLDQDRRFKKGTLIDKHALAIEFARHISSRS